MIRPASGVLLALLAACAGGRATPSVDGAGTEHTIIRLDSNLDSGPTLDLRPLLLDSGRDHPVVPPASNSGQTCDDPTACPTLDTCIKLEGWSRGMCLAQCPKAGDLCPTADNTTYFSSCSLADQSQTQWFCLYLCELSGKSYQCPDPSTQDCVDPGTPGVKICQPK